MTDKTDEHAKPLFAQLMDANAKRSILWSPYQRIDLSVFYGKQKDGDKAANDSKLSEHLFGLELGANRAFYQYFFVPDMINNSSVSTILKYLKITIASDIEKDDDLAFSLNHPKSALIVGAGTGQNVSSALALGVTDIDAVEIDPVIIEVGKRYNRDYHNPHVHLICDDARHYFSHCDKKYDVINFSTLDSHAVAGLGSSVRVDTYVYVPLSGRSLAGHTKEGREARAPIRCTFYSAWWR